MLGWIASTFDTKDILFVRLYNFHCDFLPLFNWSSNWNRVTNPSSLKAAFLDDCSQVILYWKFKSKNCILWAIKIFVLLTELILKHNLVNQTFSTLIFNNLTLNRRHKAGHIREQVSFVLWLDRWLLHKISHRCLIGGVGFSYHSSLGVLLWV